MSIPPDRRPESFQNPSPARPADESEPANRGHRPPHRRVTIIVSIALALMASAVGAGIFIHHRSAASHAADEQAAYDSCSQTLTPLMKDMAAVNARLGVGLSEDQMSHLVGNAAVSDNAMNVDKLTGSCLTVGALLETGLNKYISTVKTWNNCIADDYCTLDSIDAQLQRRWREVSRLIDRASAKLKDADPSGQHA